MGLHSVQFYGKAQVLKGFDFQDKINWALWQGRDTMMYGYSGTSEDESKAELVEWLDMLHKSSGNAIYTLRFYKDGKFGKSTPDSGSFNFKLKLVDDDGMQVGAVSGGSPAVMDAIGKLNERFDKLEKRYADDPEDGEPAAWERLLENPAVMGLVGKLFGVDMAGIDAPGAAIAGVPGDGSIDDSLDRLEKHDPKLSEHLYKLSMLAEKKPTQFKVLIGMLDSMVI